MKKIVFIYSLSDPDTEEVRYVGKTNSLGRRLKEHLRCKEKNYKTNWIKSLKSRGLLPLFQILHEVIEDHWKQWEIAWIEFYREQGCRLTNGTSGGEGGHNPTAEVREKLSKAAKGRTLSIEHRKKLSTAHAGKILSDAHKKKLAEAHLGKRPSLETRLKMSLSSAGRKHRPDTITQMSYSRLGPKNPRFGQLVSENTRLKMRRSQQARRRRENINSI